MGPEEYTRPPAEGRPTASGCTAHGDQESGSGAEDGEPDHHEEAVAPVLKITNCRVPGCTRKVSETSQRPIRVCCEHQRAAVLHMEDGQSRFCQQCRRIHPLDRFEGNRRGCKQRLAHRVERRHQRLTGTKHLIDRRDEGEAEETNRTIMKADQGTVPEQRSGGDGSDKMTNFMMSEQLKDDRKSGSGTGSENNGVGPHSTDSGGKSDTKQDRRNAPAIDGDPHHLRTRSSDGRARSSQQAPMPDMPPWLHPDWAAGRPQSAALTMQDLQSQVQWQWHSNYQIGMQLRAQQQMQMRMATQLEWQGQLLCHLNQSTTGSDNNLPPPPPMPKMPTRPPMLSRSELSSWGPGYFPSFANQSPAHGPPADGSNMERYDHYAPPPPMSWFGDRK